MLIFNLTVHHIWGRVLAKFQGARAVAYADDGYIKGKLSDVLQVLAELKRVLKEDAGLELNISKTAVLSKAITQQALFDVAYAFIENSPQLTQLSGELSLDSFRPDGFVGIGVPIGTDNFVRQFVAKKCRDIIEDVEKLDAIEDSFIHFQLLRFCQATRLQYINSHILLNNRCVLQQQHVDVKIADALLKKGTKQHADGWDAANKDWAHMVIHLPHAEGGFGVPFNCVTKDAAFYSTTSRFVSFLGAFSQERQRLWLPADDLQDSSSWTSSPLRLLRDIHSNLISKYDCKEVCAPSQSQGNLGSSARLSSQDGIPQQQEAAPLSLPQLDRLFEASFARDESSASDTGVTAIPSQLKITKQILRYWQPFQDLKLQSVGSRRQEQLSSRCQQRIVATVEESVLRMEMAGLESQEEDASQRVLFYKPMAWLGQIRPHRRDESWSAGLWQTFFSTSMGAQIPVIAEKPLAVCGCRKFKIDALGDHLCTCKSHSGAKKAHDWAVDQLADLFRTTHKVKTQQVVKSRGQHCGDLELAAYLANEAGPVPLVLDLRIAHDRIGSSANPALNGTLTHPNNIDESLNKAANDKIRKYRADYNNNPPNAVAFMPAIAGTTGRLHSEFIRLLFLQAHRETDRFFAASGVQSAQSNLGASYFHLRRAAVSSLLKSRVGNIIAKASALRVNLNLDGAPIASSSHTHPSHSQTSRLLTSSLSLGVPVPRPTQCMGGA
jgi:hypothetical protein